MRLYSIMQDFIETADCLNLNYFTEKYHVSRRTIQGDLSYFMNIGESKGFQLHTIRGKGYLLEVRDGEKFNEFIRALGSTQSAIPQITPENTTALLALQNDYISMEEIASSFDVNRSFVKKILDEVKELCRKYDVKLVIKSHHGIRIENSNLAFTGMLAEMLAADNPILSAYIENSGLPFNDLYPLLIKEIKLHKQKVNYSGLKKIYDWLTATILQASLLKPSKEEFNREDTVLDLITTELLESLSDTTGLYFTAWQYESVVKAVRENVDLSNTGLRTDDGLDRHIEKFIQVIDDEYNTKFSDDADFRKMLFEHVRLLLSRSNQKVSYKNSMLNEICIRHPLMFNIAIEFTNMLKGNYGISISQDEAAFIAMHFAGHLEKEKMETLMQFDRIAIICSSGGGCAYLLKMQLRTIFPQQQLKTFSFLSMDEMECFEPDVIFTIMPLNKEFGVPVIYIHELLEPEDLIAIRQFLSLDTTHDFELSNTFSKFDPLFSRNHFQVCTAESYEELISDMAQQLIDEETVEPEFKEKVLEREKYMSTVFFNGVALPHPIELCSKKSQISVRILEKTLMESDKEVNAVFLIALRKDEYRKYEEITKLLYRLMQDVTDSKRLSAARSFEQMRLILKEVEATIL